MEAAVVSLSLLLLQHLLLKYYGGGDDWQQDNLTHDRVVLARSHQSFLLQLLSEDSVLWQNVTQQKVVFLFL